MKNNKDYDVIIVGGSYAGLSAAMALGRALQQVLVIDSGKPCNYQTPHSHNFITQDGNTPQQIAATVKEQVLRYTTVKFHEGLAESGTKIPSGFQIQTQSAEVFTAKKLIFATGLRDIMPEIAGFADCWGISILHCPFCHGYEVKNERTGILLNGEMAFELSKLIQNWSKDLILFTNGPSLLTPAQTRILEEHDIQVNEKAIKQFNHKQGTLESIVFEDGLEHFIKVLYARPNLVQHCSIPQELGCELTDQGLIKIDSLQKTTIPGVYACGDNSNFARSLAISVASGTMAGTVLSKELIEEIFLEYSQHLVPEDSI